MGTRGPKPMPANIHILRGNPAKKPAAELVDSGIAPAVVIPKCPERNKYFRKEWNRITPILAELGLVSELDRAMLVGYCTAVADLEWAEAKIAALEDSDPDGMAGRVMMTKTGYEQISVLMSIRNKALEMVRQFAVEFGMSPSARTRVTPARKQDQAPKPAQEPGWDAFSGG